MNDTAQKTPDPIAPLASALGDGRHLAEIIARRENLIRDGKLHCWGCGSQEATYPSLHCPRCIKATLTQEAEYREAVARETPEQHRWRACGEHISKSPGLTRERALEMITRCEELPSANPDRVAELRTRFNERFGAVPPRTVKRFGGRGFRGMEDR